MDQVRKWQHRLDLFKRGIKSKTHFIQMTRGPAAQRKFGQPAKDAHRSGMNNMAELRRESDVLQAALKDFTKVLLGGGAVRDDVASEMQEFIEMISQEVSNPDPTDPTSFISGGFDEIIVLSAFLLGSLLKYFKKNQIVGTLNAP